MIKLDTEFLLEVGLERLSPSSRDAFYQHVIETLESRFGSSIAELLSGDQLDEFEELTDDDSRLQWLERTVPDYKDILRKEFETLKLEIRSVSKGILETDREM